MKVVKNGEKISVGGDAANYLNGLGKVGSKVGAGRIRSN